MKNYPPPPPLNLVRARSMRREMTGAERAVWYLLREHFAGWHWRRQVRLLGYIADFASHAARLVIEVDGGQHSPEADALRTRSIEGQGYRVLRVWNNDALGNREGVHAMIAAALEGVALERRVRGASPPSKVR